MTEIVGNIKKYVLISLLVIFTALIAFLSYKISYDLGIKESEKVSKTINSQNIKALTDSITIINLENGKLLYEKTSMVLTNEELEKLNDSLVDVIKILNKDIKTISQLNLVYRLTQDSLKEEIFNFKYLYSYDILDTTLKIKNHKIFWNFISKNSNNISLYGSTSFTSKRDSNENFTISNIKSNVDSLNLELEIYTGISKNEKSGLYEIYAYSKDSNISFNNIHSNIQTDFLKDMTVKQKKIIFGPIMGIGGSFPIVGDHKFGLSAFIGIGISYPLF
jgi:hypothetical protein